MYLVSMVKGNFTAHLSDGKSWSGPYFVKDAAMLEQACKELGVKFQPFVKGGGNTRLVGGTAQAPRIAAQVSNKPVESGKTAWDWVSPDGKQKLTFTSLVPATTHQNRHGGTVTPRAGEVAYKVTFKNGNERIFNDRDEMASYRRKYQKRYGQVLPMAEIVV